MNTMTRDAKHCAKPKASYTPKEDAKKLCVEVRENSDMMVKLEKTMISLLISKPVGHSS